MSENCLRAAAARHQQPVSRCCLRMINGLWREKISGGSVSNRYVHSELRDNSSLFLRAVCVERTGRIIKSFHRINRCGSSFARSGLRQSRVCPIGHTTGQTHTLERARSYNSRTASYACDDNLAAAVRAHTEVAVQMIIKSSNRTHR